MNDLYNDSGKLTIFCRNLYQLKSTCDLSFSRHILCSLPYLPDLFQPVRLDVEKDEKTQPDCSPVNWGIVGDSGAHGRDDWLLPLDGLALQYSYPPWEDQSSGFLHQIPGRPPHGTQL